METARTMVSNSPEALGASAHFPTATHQNIVGCLFTEISVYLKAREPQCRIMAAPFAIFLKNAGKICLQKDIVVVQDEGKLDEEGCHGAPDWVVEVVSSSSREWDYGQKLGIYINAGVREYWIVDSEKKLIVAYCLDHPDVPAIYHFGDIIKSDIYPDLIIDSSLLDHIQYKKAADTRDSQYGDTVASLAAAVTKALEETDSLASLSASSASPASIPADLVEDIITEVLNAAGQQAGILQPTNTENPDPAGEDGAALADPADVKNYILEHFADLAAARNKGQLMKAAMGALKGRADSKAVNEAVAEICK